MFNAYKYRLYPTKGQQVLLEKHFGCVRYVYNKCLEWRIEAWLERKEIISKYELINKLPILKREEETSFLKEAISNSLQQSVFNLDSAYSKFFKAKKGFPKFKNKYSKQSFRVPEDGKVLEKHISIPKLKKIKAVIDRPIEGKIKSITVSKTPTGKYFASVLCETEGEYPSKLPITEKGTIGIDLGIKDFAVLSTGEKIKNPKFLNNSLRRLKRKQRAHSRKKKGSNNREKSRKILALIHEKVANQRKDFLHKLTTRLIRDNQTDSFAIEDLAVSNMVKNHRLARHISDAGWRTFRTFLEYKAERAGKNILTIGRFEPSSKACPCGIINKDLKLSDRVWTCSCGKTHDRDINAANNIKRFALHPQNKSVPKDIREFTLTEIPQ